MEKTRKIRYIIEYTTRNLNYIDTLKEHRVGKDYILNEQTCLVSWLMPKETFYDKSFSSELYDFTPYPKDQKIIKLLENFTDKGLIVILDIEVEMTEELFEDILNSQPKGGGFRNTTLENLLPSSFYSGSCRVDRLEYSGGANVRAKMKLSDVSDGIELRVHKNNVGMTFLKEGSGMLTNASADKLRAEYMGWGEAGKTLTKNEVFEKEVNGYLQGLDGIDIRCDNLFGLMEIFIEMFKEIEPAEVCEYVSLLHLREKFRRDKHNFGV